MAKGRAAGGGGAGGRGAARGGGAGGKGKGGALSWLHRACGEMLSQWLMGKNGVQHVINGVLDVTGGT